MISHWDDVEEVRRERGHIAATWQSLSGDDSFWVGVQRIRIDPGRWATPLHLEGCEEELFFVLAGSGVSLQRAGEGEEAYAVEQGDFLVHRALEHAHTLQAGPEGLDVLAFGERSYAANTLLPRAGVSWLGPTWVLEGVPEDHPWAREVAAGEPSVGELSDRPSRIVRSAGVSPEEYRGETVVRTRRNLGVAAGSLKTGMNLCHVEPGKLMTAPHCHSEEEEIFVVLEGSGEVELWPHPRSATEPGWAAEHEKFEVRVGSTVSVRAGTGRAHSFTAGPDGLVALAYGQRKSNDICFYPRSGKVSLRGVGVIGRLEQLDYWDGED